MSELPANVETQGLRAYEQARAFEAVRSRRLPLIYAALDLLLLAAAAVTYKLQQPALALFFLFTTLISAGTAFFNWRRLQVQHALNLRLLAELEGQYGEKLPWIQMERHFAALDKLQAELRAEADTQKSINAASNR